jgi:hypothetical protein
MSMDIETVKVKDGHGSYYIINKEDFDDKKHELFKEKAEPKKQA